MMILQPMLCIQINIELDYSSQKQDLNEDMTVFDAVLSSDTTTLRIIKQYEQAVQAYADDQSDKLYDE